jgi:alpha-L-arabinofuranosidase
MTRHIVLFLTLLCLAANLHAEEILIGTGSGKKEILLKVVNKKGTAETVNISLKGAGNINPDGHSTTMTGALDTENSLSDPTNIVTSNGSFKAGSSFNYTFPSNSVSVLRIGYKE